MLNQRERRAVLQYIHYSCKFAPFPAEVNLESWSLGELAGLKRGMSFLFYANALLHTIFKLASLVYVLGLKQDVPLYQVILHVGLVVGYTHTCFCVYTAYIKNFHVHKTLVQTILKPMHSNGKSRGSNGRKTYRLLEYTPQDAIVLFMPPTVAAILSGFVMYCWLDSSGMYLYYNLLPDTYKITVFLLICLGQEFHCLMYSIAVIVPILQLQVIAFDDICYRLGLVFQTLTKSSSNTIGQEGQTTEVHVMTLRNLQIYMLLMNSLHCYLIFTYKLFSIIYCVGMGYAAVAYFHDNIALAIICCLSCADIGTIYSLVYQKGFQVQSAFAQVVQAMMYKLTGNRGNGQGSGNAVIKRQLKSVPSVGIKVGNFHTLERTSTPIFLDFVGRNIVSMLVVYH